MWYFLIRSLFNFFIFLVQLFEKFLDLDKKWVIFIISLFSCSFTEWSYGLFGENRPDYFFSLVAAWFPLWFFLVTEFILLKSFKIHLYFIYIISITLIYLFFSLTQINVMPFLFYPFWIYFYFATLIYCSFMLSFIILLCEHFRIIQRLLHKLKKLILSLILLSYSTVLILLLIIYFAIYFYFYIIFLSIYTIYLFIKYICITEFGGRCKFFRKK